MKSKKQNKPSAKPSAKQKAEAAKRKAANAKALEAKAKASAEKLKAEIAAKAEAKRKASLVAKLATKGAALVRTWLDAKVEEAGKLLALVKWTVTLAVDVAADTVALALKEGGVSEAALKVRKSELMACHGAHVADAEKFAKAMAENAADFHGLISEARKIRGPVGGSAGHGVTFDTTEKAEKSINAMIDGALEKAGKMSSKERLLTVLAVSARRVAAKGISREDALAAFGAGYDAGLKKS